MQQWSDKKVLVLGLDETGLSLARWLVAQGARVRAEIFIGAVYALTAHERQEEATCELQA